MKVISFSYKNRKVLREDLKKNRKFGELGIICLSTYPHPPPLNCDNVNSDKLSDNPEPTNPAVIVTKGVIVSSGQLSDF